MLENQSEIKRIFSTTMRMFQEQGDEELTTVLKDANFYSKAAHYDGWNGGTHYFELYLEIDASLVALNEDKITDLEERFKKKFGILLEGHGQRTSFQKLSSSLSLNNTLIGQLSVIRQQKMI